MKNLIQRFFFLVITFFTLNTIQARELKIIPLPNSVEFGEGDCVLSPSLTVKGNDAEMLDLFAQWMKKFGGVVINTQINPQVSTGGKELYLKLDPQWNDSSYQISVKPDFILLRSGKGGMVSGVSTLTQLLLGSFSGTSVRVPICEIKDQPRFQWRGMHLDVGRHFFPVSFIKKYLDIMAFYKMNVFHWHLTEDQGWRIQIKKYPALTEVGAWRSGSMVGHYNDQKFDNEKYGGFYTQEEIKEVVKYATERNITVVPEIEMPGHSLAALAAYPNLSCTGGPFKVAKSWGVFEDVYCAKEETFLFLEDVLTEVVALFPGQYIHIGGDECPKERWKKCENCQKVIRDNNLKDEHELQSYFIQRIEKFLNAKGKKIIGWDEILEGGLAPNAAVMSWRGTEGGIAAAKQKHAVVMTPGSHCYFDHYQGSPASEPVAIGGYTTLQKVYAYEPVPAELKEDEKKFILGAQGNVWTEYMNDEQHVEYMVLPRMLALAEVLWLNPTKKNESDFIQRLQHQLLLLNKASYHYSEAVFKVEIKTSANNGGLKIELSGLSGLGKIHYVMNPSHGGQKSLMDQKDYSAPIEVKSNSTITAWLELNGQTKPKTTQRIWLSKASGKTVTFRKNPSEHYSGNGGFTLVDGIKGDRPRVNSQWLAWSGEDMVATIDLGAVDSVKNVQLGFLEDKNNWIWAPKSVEVLVSTDGRNFKSVLRREVKGKDVSVPEIMMVFKPVKARFVQVVATNPGLIPVGNPGAGKNSWIFFDEILVN